METLTVTTFNVLHVDRDRTGRALTAAAGLNTTAPDLVLLQEVPFEDGRSAYLETLTAATGLAVAYARPLTEVGPGTGHRSGLAILHGPRLAPEATGTLPVPAGLEGYSPTPQGCWAVLGDGPAAVGVLNLHGVWGGARARERELQVLAADRVATSLRRKLADREPLVLLGGDLNAVPESSALRFLTGLESLDGAGTYWVDAWAVGGDGGPGHTSTPGTGWFLDTARAMGISDPTAIPARRIDYLLVQDWVYGRRGHPLRTWVDLTGTGAGGRHASDHFAVSAVLDTGRAQDAAGRLSSASRLST